MHAQYAVTIPGPADDVVRFLREAFAAAQDATRANRDAPLDTALATDWRTLVPEPGDTTTIDFAGGDQADGSLTIEIRGTPVGTTEIRGEMVDHFHVAMKALDVVPGAMTDRIVAGEVHELEETLTRRYRAWTAGAPARLDDDTSPRPSPPAGDPPPPAQSVPPAAHPEIEAAAANRDGRLTSDQLRALRRRKRSWYLRDVEAAVLVGIIVTWEILRTGVGFAVPIACGALVAFAIASAGRRVTRVLAADLEDGTCRTVSGFVHPRRAGFRVQVGEEGGGTLKLMWSGPPQMLADREYRVFFLPRSRLVVNAEPILPAPAPLPAVPPPPPARPARFRWRRVAPDGTTLVEGAGQMVV